VQKQVLKRW